MPILSRITNYLRNILAREKTDHDLDDEVRSYSDLLAQEKIREGMSPQKARREAILELGGIEQVKEQVRELRSGAWLGRPVKLGEEPEVQTRTILGNYFSVMGIPLLRGRDFSAQDREDTPVVVVVNETFVRTFFPNQDPLGARVEWSRDKPGSWKTIVGVVGDVKHFGLDQPEQPAVYDLYSQMDEPWKRWMSLAVRSPRDPGELTRAVEAQIWALDRGIPPTAVLTMKDVMDASVTPRKFNLTLMMIFAGVALTLAAIGIYGVVAYSVTQRTHEIGVRVALGAQQRDIVRLVLGEGARLALLGAVLGLTAAAALTRFMASLLFGVSIHDPLTFFAVAAVLVCVAAAACCIPARRAMRVDPMVALRYE